MYSHGLTWVCPSAGQRFENWRCLHGHSGVVSVMGNLRFVYLKIWDSTFLAESDPSRTRVMKPEH